MKLKKPEQDRRETWQLEKENCITLFDNKVMKNKVETNANWKSNTKTKEVKDIKVYTESEYGWWGINWNQNNLLSIK